MDLFGFNESFGFDLTEEKKEVAEVSLSAEKKEAVGAASEASADNSSGMDDIFGGFGFATEFTQESFFETPKKETKKKEEKTKTQSAKKKEEKPKDSKYDKEVKLPVVVKARNFSEEIAGDGTKKLSEIWKILLEKGYDQFKSESFSLFYHEISNSVFVCDNSLFGDDDATLISLSDEEKVIIVDGQVKAEFGLEDFPGVEEDDLCIRHIKEKFVEINSMYEGCKVYFDEKVKVCYPVLSEVSEKDFSDGNYTSYVKEGVVTPIAEETYADIKGAYGEMNQKNGGADVLVCKGGNGTVFISFRNYSGYKPGASSTSNSKSDKKVAEQKYKLPLKVFVANWGEEFIVSDEDLKKEKATLKEIRDFLGTKNRLFKDSSRKVDHFYDEENGRMSMMFVSGSKGCELIRSQKEYEEVRKGTSFFDGVYTEAPHENVRVRVLPAGNFLTFFGKGEKAGEIHRMEWERKLPKIPKKILDEIVGIFRKDLKKEAAARVYYHRTTGEFSVKEAGGERSKVRINYLYEADSDIMRGEKIQVLDIHSHNTFDAFFSPIDNADDGGFPCLSAVIGKLQEDEPKVVCRAGVDGMFTSYPLSEVFDI